MSSRSSNPKPNNPPIFGDSSLGYNGREATADGFAPVRNTEIIEVELFYDQRFDNEISKHAMVDEDNREDALRLADKTHEDEAFRRSIGIN